MDQLAARPFSAADFRLRAARETGPYHGADYGDHRLNPSLTDLIVREGLRDAAVLMTTWYRSPLARSNRVMP